MIIEYCNKCGQRVAEDDLVSGAARKNDDGGVLCPQCAPPRKAEPRGRVPSAGPATTQFKAVTTAATKAVVKSARASSAMRPDSGSPKRLMLVASIVGVALGVLGLALMLARSKNAGPGEPQKPSVQPQLATKQSAKPADSERPAPDVVQETKKTAESEVSKPVETTKAETPTTASAGTIDLLKLTNVQRDSDQGGWSIRDGVLRVSKESKFTRLEFPYVPPQEYDVKATFTRLDSDECLYVHLTRDERQFGYILAGWKNTVAGFDMVAGKRAKDDPANTRSQPVLTNGKKCSLLIEVRSDALRAYIDGKLTNECKAPSGFLSLPVNWALKHMGRLGIGSGSSTYEIHSLEVREVKGQGRVVSP
ncbi:MAG TPA: hypothetical protein VGP72_13925 [Planctomycetota bacterium]|jgi:hypothetical protein